MKPTQAKVAALFILFILCISHSHESHAAKRRSKKKYSDRMTTVSSGISNGAVNISLPQSEILIQPENKPASAPLDRIELSTSTWAPRPWDAPTYLPGTSPFEISGLPEIELTCVLAPSANYSWGRMAWKAGLGLFRMSRVGQETVIGGPHSTDQLLYAIPFRVGAEWNPAFVHSETFFPYVALSALPAVTLTTRSALSDSETRLGLTCEVAIGTAVSLRKLVTWIGPEGSSGDRLQLDVGVIARGGQVQGLDFSGFGVQGGLRYSL